jgi:hypothetical protein
MACSTASSYVTDGQCMSTDVANVLNDECYEAGAALLEMGPLDKSSVQSAMKKIHSTCAESIEQVCAFFQPKISCLSPLILD